MELLFEARQQIVGVEGKLNFVQRKAQLHPEPVLVGDTFVDGTAASVYGSVLRDGGRYRMWYQAWPSDWNGQDASLVAHAESDDGVVWKKTPLGLYKHGPNSNHLTDLGLHCPSVYIDPAAPASHRYRATGHGCPGGQGMNARAAASGYFMAHSADGLKWELDDTRPAWAGGDTIRSIWHPARRAGLVSLKHAVRYGGIGRRALWTADVQDGRPGPDTCALVPDSFDDVAAAARGFASGDYYGMAMLAAGRGTVGFIEQFRHTLPRTATGAGHGIFGSTDASLCFQAGPGEAWLHVAGRPDFLTHGAAAWNRGGTYLASGPTEFGDEHRLYLTGAAVTHAWYVDERWNRIPHLTQRLTGGNMAAIGFARWPKWRLFGFDADPDGELVLNLGRRRGPWELRLNYETRAGGSVRVEVERAAARSMADAVALEGEALSATAAWQSGTRITSDPEQDAVVRLRMHEATVYAYEIVAKV